MIEQIMIFALGFLFAGLLTLLFLPAFWRRALRLSTRRLEMQMPLSMAEIVAERDQLRAEFAASARRVEQRNERLVESSAVHQSQLGRQAAMMVDLDAKLLGARRDAEATHADLIAAQREINETRAEFGALQKEVYDATGLAERRTQALAELERRHAALDELADERRMTIGALETQSSGLRMELDDTERRLSASELKLADRIAALALVERERDFARSDAAANTSRREALQASLDEAGKRIEAMEQQERSSQRAHTRMSAQVIELQRAVETAGAHAQNLQALDEGHSSAMREAERAASERLQTMRAERDALQGAIDMLRAENQTMRQEIADLRRAPRAANDTAPGSADDALLRQTIAEIGAEVTRIAGALDAETAAERMRALQMAGRP